MSATDEAPTVKPIKGRNSSGRDFEFEATLGSRIRAARLAAGMNQRVFGDAVGIAYQKLQKYELGKDRIAVSTLQRIARALGLHPGEFFDDPMPKAVGATLDVEVARRSIELVQEIPDLRVVKRLLALVEELGADRGKRESRPPAHPMPEVEMEKDHRVPVTPSQAVVAPLVAMLQQVGTNDAGSLAKLLGQALAEAEKILKS